MKRRPTSKTKMNALDARDSRLRARVLRLGRETIAEERIEVPRYTADELNQFAMGWRAIGQVFFKDVNRLLADPIPHMGEDSPYNVRWGVLRWISHEYRLKRLHSLLVFCEYCDWITPQEIVGHFAWEGVSMFLAIRGPAPAWATTYRVPYHVLLQAACKALIREHRKAAVKSYLDAHWEEACEAFNEGTAQHVVGMPCDARGWVTPTHIHKEFERRLRALDRHREKNSV